MLQALFLSPKRDKSGESMMPKIKPKRGSFCSLFLSYRQVYKGLVVKRFYTQKHH